MSGIKLEKFGAMLPGWNEHYIPQSQGSYARNTYVHAGTLYGWRKPELIHTLVSSTAKFAYRIPAFTKATADANLIFVGNPIQGDTVKIGEEIYTFTATVTNANDILIGATATASAQNLYLALTLGDTPGVNYGDETDVNSAISDTGTSIGTFNFGTGDLPWLYIKAPDTGKAFNATVVTESSGGLRLTWLSSPLSSLANTVSSLSGGLNTSFNSAITAASTWLEFDDRDTNVIRSPVVDDQFQRHYFASPSLPPQYNTYDRIVAGEHAWQLGVPAPGCAPTVDVSGGGDSGTVGNTVSQAFNDTLVDGNHIGLVRITPDGALQLDSVSFIPNQDLSYCEYAAVLYEDDNGTPTNLLNVGAVVVGLVSGSTMIAPFVNPTGLTSGVTYWIGIIASDPVHTNDCVGALDGRTVAATFTNGPPQALGPMTAVQDYLFWGNVTTQGVLTARAYVYTWITEYNEEGPPSPPALVEAGWSNGTWTIGLFTPPADDMGVLRNITKKRLYRTITAQGGQTDYFYVTELDVNVDSFVDTDADDTVALNSILPSNVWFPPPEGLLGIKSMPNGMTVGFKENELWFSEPYRPHAWPPDFVLTTAFPIIGIGVIGNAVVAATAGNPYIAAGPNPSSMGLVKIDVEEPCLSRRSVLGTDKGVYYASANGLMLVRQDGQASNSTESWIKNNDWKRLTPQKYITAINLASIYFAYATVQDGDNSLAQQGYTIESGWSVGTNQNWPMPGDARLGFTILNSPFDTDIDNVLNDPWTSAGMLITNGGVYYFNFANENPDIMPYKWRSKMFQGKHRENYAAFRVTFDTPSTGIPAQSAARNTDVVQTLAEDQYIIVRVYGGGSLLTTREVRTSGELLRIASTVKVENWQFEIEGRVEITNMQFATSVKELRKM